MSFPLPPVCILTAGSGTRMGSFSSVINKCLLPYKNTAIISHIITSFPKGTPFVIALGYKEKQVRDYLSIAHPNTEFHFVLVDKFVGQGTGPGYSLLCCRAILNKPFYFVSCDTLFGLNLEKSPEQNWVGLAKIPKEQQISYCNMAVSKGKITHIYDKKLANTVKSYAFTGLMYIRDHAEFWAALEKPYYIGDEHQISNGLLGLIKNTSLHYVLVDWLDMGTYEKYRQAVTHSEKYDFSKTNEFLYCHNARVIKFFSDEKIINGRVKKAAMNPLVFPRITHVAEQWYSYDFIPGNTLYADNNPALFNQLLLWLETKLWTTIPAISPDHMQSLCRQFYYDKTLSRLSDYEKKYPNSISYTSLNGQPIESIPNLMRDIPWDELFLGLPAFMHGDLQFDNILYDKNSDQFFLLDWRQDFAGEIAFGDIYYDLAKLMGGIIINYDYIKAGLFHVEEISSNLNVDFAQRFNGHYYLNSLEQYIMKRGYDYKRVCLLVGLIYLNMSPLHHPPFDKALHALGRKILTEVLYGDKPTSNLKFNASMVALA